MSAITVLGGGFSASLLNLRRLPGAVIAVNDAAIYAPRVDLIVSMDRIWTEQRFSQVARFGVPLWLRRSTLGNVPWHDCKSVTPFECDHKSTTLSDEPGHLNGTNSGFCALNLAYQMRPKNVYLVGFDMALGPRGERHWFPDYPWKGGGGSGAGKLDEWALQFKTAARQCRAQGMDVELVTSMRIPKVRAFAPISPRALDRLS